ncbi:MAG: S1 family peptidase [Defluviitaleaceae bacterium]|nr:S1 family peptidase [Defluviitaleaceae bacterium]
MKNFMKKSRAALMGATLTFGSVTSPVYASSLENQNSNLENYLNSYFGYEFVQNHSEALQIAEKLYGLFPRTRMGQVIYPDYFGGRYINENGELVILKVQSVLDRAKTTISRFNTAISQFNSDANIRKVEFSFNELVEVIDYLDNLSINERSTAKIMIDGYEVLIERYVQPRTNYISNIAGWGLDIAKNRIVVDLIDYSQEAITDFKNNVLDSPVFEFRQGEVISLEYNHYYDFQTRINEFNYTLPNEPIVLDERIRALSPLRPGDRIFIWRQGQGWIGQLGIGYRAYLNFLASGTRAAGFITAAHVHLTTVPTGVVGIQNGDIVADNSGIRIGVVNGNALQSFDAAFVSLDNVNTLLPTNSDQGTRILSPAIQGQLLMMQGANSGRQLGTVEIERQTISVGSGATSFIVNNAIRTNYSSQPGDSGSVVYAIQANGTITGVAGIHFASNGVQRWVSRADHIRTMFAPANVLIELR